MLEAGETVTISWANVTSLTLTVDGTTVVNAPPPETGSTTYTVPANGPRAFSKTVSGPPDASVTLTCTAAPSPTPPQPTPPQPTPTPTLTPDADQAAANRDALERSTNGSRPSSDPSGLPGSGTEGADPCGLLERRFGELVGMRTELELTLDALSLRLVNLGNQLEGRPAASQRQSIVEERNRLEETHSRIERELNAVKGRLRSIDKELADCRDRNRIFEDDESVELGDSEEILYAPKPERFGTNVPWPVTALGYEYRPMTTINSSSEHGFAIAGRPAKLWARLNGFILDGTLGRSGTTGSLQAGLVVGVTPSIDIGFVGHILAGTVQSATIGGSLSSVAGGAGLYAKVHLPNDFRFGLSALHEWGGHNITLAGATGFYTSSYWAVSAALSRPFAAGAWVVTPGVSGTWNQLTNGGYTDSNGLVVPATGDSTLHFSGTLDFARPMARPGGRISQITPRVTINANYFAQAARTLTLGGLGTLSSSSFTLDIGAGVALSLASGGVVDLALQARGLAGNERSYGARIGARMPLN